MRITPLTNSRPIADEAAVDQPRNPGAKSRSEVLPAETKAAPPAALRAGLTDWDPQVNRQLASAQQALSFIDQVEARLQALKSDLSAKLAAGERADPKVDRKLREFADLWQQRRAASGGALDNQLAFSPDAEARLRFRIQGLDRNALQKGDKETLAFSAGGAGQRLMVVAIEPGLSEAALARRFDRALTPAGIRVQQDAQGLALSVAESAWPTIRDTLSIKGAGIRFPSGQLARVKADAEPEAIRPAEWSAVDEGALRRTLQDVLNALDRVRQAREALNRAVAEARSRLDDSVASALDKEWAFSFAADFQALAQQPAYQVYSAIAPALVSINRNRVLSLLALN
jgi:hypothetical protein